MTLAGGKRKVNKSLKSWVAFVKRVQKEEKLNYKDAIHRAKVRKDKGEKWMMKGGDGEEIVETVEEKTPSDTEVKDLDAKLDNEPIIGGKRKTRRHRKSKKSRKTKRRRSRRH